MAKTQNEIWTTLEESPNHSVAKLIKAAADEEQQWLIKDLWQTNAIMAVHSREGHFKSIFAYQIAEALATGQAIR